ncbi:hypothetical protein DFP72DRAFT_1009356 [Ephemerocybe angulata]|uniref:DUF6729 domain-containing protein n=1 Tax=Ephemerocybe angulata TaxID=980116 RepID=A0A8H6HWZ5_9AGAR|nr:hypothetical protein DFP72DRAFT_1009356 [Tulosesus angulatus]
MHRSIFLPRPATSFLLRDPSKASPQALYNPQFALWDPMPLCPQGIPCPKCKAPLQRHTHIPRPRRVVDFTECFWLIGYRYRCRDCKCTFRSWDKRVLDLLPPNLALEFPARLSHRSGTSKNLMEWVRMCFHGGMGAKQVSDCLRHQHLVHYDTLRLQYFHQLQAARNLNAWLGRKFDSFNLKFEDRTPMGYHGYVPSGQYIREMFDAMIEEHRDDYHQHMAMLPLTIGAADHSHKLSKQILRVSGQESVIGLHCITNEFSEIRACHLVTTKGHSQTALALKSVRESLERYGHEMPKVFFTDNMADKALLEEVFPSLTEDVVPADKYEHLPELDIPEDVHVFVKDTARSIEMTVESILDDLDLDGSGELVVGFDTEWNVETSPNGQVKHTGKTAIAQLAYKKQIYILQISDMVAQGTLPVQLRNLLADPHVIKVGRNIGRDLKLLEEACHSTEPFKDEALTDRQKRYAAIDAYASLRIYEEMSKFSVPAPISNTTVPTPATPVLLYAPDKSKVIAIGQISLHSLGNAFDGIQLESATTVIEVFHVISPGAKLKTHRKRTLQDFGKTPFSAIVPKSMLRTIVNVDAALASVGAVEEHEGTPLGTLLLGSDDPNIEEGHDQCDDASTGAADVDTSGYVQDEAAAAEGSDILGDVPRTWNIVIRSRVLKDVFHLFNQFYISVKHGLRLAFIRALRDAIFLLDEDDVRRVKNWAALQNPPLTFEKLLATHPKWVLLHIRRIIPPPEILYFRVRKVFETYGPLKDATTKAPLFNANNWKISRNILDLVYHGYISDPPGVPMYGEHPDSANSILPLYRCFRGTNRTEGAVHTHLRSHLPSSGTSIRHVEAALDDFTLIHNITNGTHNRTGGCYRGHFSPWIINDLQDLTISLQDVLAGPCDFPGHVNGTYYIQTSERIGVLPVPPAVRADGGMCEYNPSVDRRRKHHHLAMLQGVSKAILPVHTDQERDLFHALMQFHPVFNTPSGDPNWKQGVRVWNQYADTSESVFYKLIEQMRAYYSHWSTNAKIKVTLSRTKAERDRLRALLAVPIPHPAILTRQRDSPANSSTVEHGLRTPPNGAGSTSPSPMDDDENGAGNTAPSSSTPDTAQPATVHEVMEAMSRKRVADTYSAREPAKRSRRGPRHCAKCTLQDCKGKKSRNLCGNVCPDCKRPECPGRNSRRPGKKCWEAWD